MIKIRNEKKKEKEERKLQDKSLEIRPDLYLSQYPIQNKAKGILTKSHYNKFLYIEETLKLYLRIHL